MHNLLFLDGLGAPEIILIMIPLSYFALIAYCLIDVLRSDFKDSTNKLIWILVILFAPFIGSIIYLIIGRNSKTA